MPSPRASPIIRPSSPLAFASHKPNTLQYEMLSSSTPRQPYSRPTHPSRSRMPSSSLKLPSLPRFHPANYPSAHSSVGSTPDGTDSPQPPTSPRSHQKFYTNVQKQLYSYQREMMLAAQTSSSGRIDRPERPRLAPLGSPGPVTPFALDASGGYFDAASSSRSVDDSTSAPESIEQVLADKAKKHRMALDRSRPSSDS